MLAFIIRNMDKTAFIGIDVSKRFHVAHIQGSVCGQQKPFTFSHSEQGFIALDKWLSEVAPGQHRVFGVEPTEPFSGTLAGHLRRQGQTVHIIPGVYTKRGKFFYTQSGLKTDAVDAQVIAMLLQNGQYKEHVPQAQAFGELRELAQQYLRIAQQKRACMQRVQCLLDYIWPEFSRHIRLQTRTAQQILRRFRDPSEIAAMPARVFEHWVWEVSKGQIKSAAELHRSAVENIGSARCSQADELQMELDILEFCERQYERLVSSIGGWLQHVPYSQQLLTIPGYGSMLTGVLLGQAGDLRNYDSERQLYKIAGLNLIEYSSGQYKSPVRISKSGSRALRRVLFSASVAQCGGGRGLKGLFRDWYVERRAAGIPRKKLIINVSRRMLRFGLAIANSGQPFDRDLWANARLT